MFLIDSSQHFKHRFKLIKDNKEQDKILTWMDNVKKYGLFNYPQLAMPGKLAPSWSNLDPTDPHYAYAQKNNLWHYHIGHETYVKGLGDYLTSNWIVHFIWDKRNPNLSYKIKLVDYTPHKVLDNFPMPKPFMLGD